MTYNQILGAVVCGGRHAGKRTLTPPEKRALLQQLKSMDFLAGHAEYREEIAVDAPMAPGSDSLQ
jgi:hypothetical protein